MNEIYWITRLNAICGFLTLTSILGAFISFILFMIAMFNRSESNTCMEFGKSWNKYIKNYKTFMLYFKRSIIATLVLIVINIFIPTTNEALLIYGVGGTIDYIKSNNTAKQLPDKCIKALDKWVENLNEKEEQEKKVE